MRDKKEDSIWKHTTSRPPLDTVIFINSNDTIYSDNNVIPQLTLSKTKKILYSYYLKKGSYIEKPTFEYGDTNSENYFNKDGSLKYVIEFDTSYFVSLNNDDIYDAIVLFKKIPAIAGCGHCLGYSSKAIIVNNGKKFNLTREDFISDYHIIDSIKQITPNSIFIYGWEYDCRWLHCYNDFLINIKLKLYRYEIKNIFINWIGNSCTWVILFDKNGIYNY